MDQATEKLTQKMLPLLRKAGVVRSSLFGSVARGEMHAESDIDVLVEFPQKKSLIDLVRLERELQTALGKKVDLVTYKSLSPYLRENILREQIRIL